MENPITIKIFSLTNEIYKLIAKVLDKYNFRHEFVIITDTDSRKTFEAKLKGSKDSPEVIIIDKEIPSELKEMIIGRYNGASVICLPSLNETDIVASDRVSQISEPLKLSEFENVILKITKKDK